MFDQGCLTFLASSLAVNMSENSSSTSLSLTPRMRLRISLACSVWFFSSIEFGVFGRKKEEMKMKSAGTIAPPNEYRQPFPFGILGVK